MPSKKGARFKWLEACELIRKFSKACGAKNPETLRGTLLRKQFATTCATKCTEKQISHVAKYMGHDLKIHHDYYEVDDVTKDIVGMVVVLENAQNPSSGTYVILDVVNSSIN